MYKTDALTIAPREYVVAGVGLEPTSAAYETALETTSRHPAMRVLFPRHDLNLQPPAYQAGALTNYATREYVKCSANGIRTRTRHLERVVSYSILTIAP